MGCHSRRCCCFAAKTGLVISIASVIYVYYQVLMNNSVQYRTSSEILTTIDTENEKANTDISDAANRVHRKSNTRTYASGTASRVQRESNTNVDTSGTANRVHRKSKTNVDTSDTANRVNRTSKTNVDTSHTANRVHRTSKTNVDTPVTANRVHWTSNISYNGPFLKSNWNILNKTPPVFHPGLKNPCWYEMEYKTTEAMKRCRRRFGPISRICSVHSHNNNARLLCLPYFMVIGLTKCGTTDLYNRIIDHPDVTPATQKEPMFWRYYHQRDRRKNITYSSYTRYFSVLSKSLQYSGGDGKSEHITGEASASTLWDVRWWWSYQENQYDEEPGLINARFIRHLIPDVKLLVTLRNPTDRLYSEYLYFNSHTHPTAEIFHTIVVKELNRFNVCMTKHSIRHCVYKDTNEMHVHLVNGIYAVFLKDWFGVFPRDQFLILQLEYATLHITETMSTVYKFLNLVTSDVSDKYGNANKHLNERTEAMKKVGEMKKETRIILNKFYEPYNKELALLLNDLRWTYIE